MLLTGEYKRKHRQAMMLRFQQIISTNRVGILRNKSLAHILDFLLNDQNKSCDFLFQESPRILCRLEDLLRLTELRSLVMFTALFLTD